MLHSGTCNCAAVKVSITEAPRVVGFCHCRTCQRQSGGPGTVFLIVPEGGVSVEGDHLRSYESLGGIGLPVQREFCGSCGSPVISRAASMPGVVFVKGGVLDDCPAPKFEVWCEEAMPWVGKVENAHRFDRQPPPRG